MLYIGKRGYDILNIILEEDKAITSAELSDRVGATTRTIKQDIKELNEYLQKYNSSIVGKQGVGYRLVSNNINNLKEMKMKLKHNQVVQYNNIPRSSTERQNYIIKKLLLVDYFITIEDLSEELYISKATIAKDISAIKYVLTDYSLHIESRPNNGILLCGSEVEKRNCILDYFFREYENQNNILANNIMFASSTSQGELNDLRKEIVKLLKHYELDMPEASIGNLTIHLYILIRRVRLNNTITLDTKIKEKFINYYEYNIASDLVGFIERNFNLYLEEDEKIYITMHIRSKTTNLKGFEDNEIISEDLKNILDMIEKKYSLRFNNQNLIEMLRVHLYALLERLSIDLQIRNKAIEQKMEYYPLATEISNLTCKYIYIKYGYKTGSDERNFLLSYYTALLMDYYSCEKTVIGVIAGTSRAETCLFNNLLKQNSLLKNTEIVNLNLFDLEDSAIVNRMYVILTTINIGTEDNDDKIYFLDPYDLNGIDVIAKHIHKLKQLEILNKSRK